MTRSNLACRATAASCLALSSAISARSAAILRCRSSCATSIWYTCTVARRAAWCATSHATWWNGMAVATGAVPGGSGDAAAPGPANHAANSSSAVATVSSMSASSRTPMTVAASHAHDATSTSRSG